MKHEDDSNLSNLLTSFDGDPVGTLEGDWLGIRLGISDGERLGVDVGFKVDICLLVKV